MLMTNQLTLTLQDIVNGQVSLNLLWNIVSLFLIYQSGFLLNTCYLLALLFFLASIYSNNEIYVMKNLGIGDGKLFAWLSVPAIFIATIIASLVFYLAPISRAQIQEIYGNQFIYKFENLQEGKTEFIDGNSFSVKDNKLEILSVEHDASYYTIGGLDPINKPYWSNGFVKVPLFGGKSLIWSDQGDVTITYFDVSEVNIRLDQKTANSYKSLPTAELLQRELRGYDRTNREDIKLRVELYERMAIFITSLFILPLALVASRRQARSTPAMNIFRGLLTYFVYLILIVVTVDIIRSGGSVAPFWLLHLVFNGTIIAMLVVPELWQRIPRANT